MSLIDLLPTSRFGFHGGQPPLFDLGPTSTLHDTTSIDGNPSFGSYKDAYIRKQKATKLSRGTGRIPHYLDNPPK